MRSEAAQKACENCGGLYGPKWGMQQFLASRACSRACAWALGQTGRTWPTLAERFWRKVDKAPGHGPRGDCWLWRGAMLADGYGTVRVGARSEKAHRAAYRLHCSEVPPGRMILHNCDIRGCVNPAHLRLGDHVSNMDDMVSRGRARAPRGVAHYAAKLTPEDVAAIRSDQRRHADIGEAFGISKSTVQAIKQRRIWRHLP